MEIFVDADACPKSIKEILYRAAEKNKIPLTLVANTHIRTPPIPFFRSVSVPEGFDLADDRIVDLVKEGDLVVTADIPLADRVIKKGACALDPRGELLDENSISQRLAIRNLAHELRSTGVNTGGPAPFSPRDRQKFASRLQAVLAKHGIF